MKTFPDYPSDTNYPMDNTSETDNPSPVSKRLFILQTITIKRAKLEPFTLYNLYLGEKGTIQMRPSLAQLWHSNTLLSGVEGLVGSHSGGVEKCF